MNDLLKSLGLYIDIERDKLNTFKRFNQLLVNDQIDDGCTEYIFFVKPELNIYSDTNGYVLNTQLNGEPIFKDIHNNNKGLLSQLQASISTNKSPFINLLSYTVRNTVDMPSINSDSVETSKNAYGSKISYRTSSFKSNESHEFTLEFADDKNLSVYNLFKAWDTYNNLKSLGIVTPPDDSYVVQKISHDKIGIYKFIVASDRETILFYSYCWGVYPTGVPRESFSEFNGGTPTYSVEFHADFIDDMDPVILSDFNALVEPYRTGKLLPLYDTRNMRPNGENAKIPFIQKADTKYKLRWEA